MGWSKRIENKKRFPVYWTAGNRFRMYKTNVKHLPWKTYAKQNFKMIG